MVCTKCGQQQPDDTKFCSNCGADLQAVKQESNPTPAPVAENQNQNPDPISPQPTINTKNTVVSVPIAQQQQPHITCPKCHSTNVNVQVINNVQLKDKHHGCAWWIFVGWWWLPIKWLVFTLPALIIKLIKPKKQKVVNKVQSMAVCQSCGHQWRV